MTPSAKKSGTPKESGVSLPVKIEARAPEDKVWREISRVENVSRMSADFYLRRPVESGQLLLLKMPVKKALRRFDLDREQYRVWSIVRSCDQTIQDNFPAYHINVAFIGQEAPADFQQNPLTIYKLDKIGENGFWKISELRRGPENRRQPR